jgi:hypothetical protein
MFRIHFDNSKAISQFCKIIEGIQKTAREAQLKIKRNIHGVPSVFIATTDERNLFSIEARNSNLGSIDLISKSFCTVIFLPTLQLALSQVASNKTCATLYADDEENVFLQEYNISNKSPLKKHIIEIRNNTLRQFYLLSRSKFRKDNFMECKWQNLDFIQTISEYCAISGSEGGVWNLTCKDNELHINMNGNNGSGARNVIYFSKVSDDLKLIHRANDDINLSILICYSKQLQNFFNMSQKKAGTIIVKPSGMLHHVTLKSNWEIICFTSHVDKKTLKSMI